MRSARRMNGIAEWTFPTRTVTCSTFACCHCNRITVVEQGAKADDCGGFCRLCMKPTCKTCADKGCTPFESKLERMEARERMLASMGL